MRNIVYLTIGQLAERSGVSPSALRFYETKGLIASIRTNGSASLSISHAAKNCFDTSGAVDRFHAGRDYRRIIDTADEPHRD